MPIPVLDPLEGWKATAPVHEGFAVHGVPSMLSSARIACRPSAKFSLSVGAALRSGAAGKVLPAECIDKEFAVLMERNAPMVVGTVLHLSSPAFLHPHCVA